MALVKQAGSRNWWISIYMGKGKKRKYIPTSTDDRGEAEALEKLVVAAYKGNMERERFIAAVDSMMGWETVKGIPVQELWETYLKTKPTAGSHTINVRRRLCLDFVAWIEEERPVIRRLDEITPQVATAFTDWLLEQRGGKGKSQNNRVSHMRTVFKKVYVRAGLLSNPFDGVETVPEDDSVSGRPFTAKEQKLIFERCAAAGNDWLPVCLLAKYSGLRLKDIALLKWKQVKDDYIDLTPAKTRKHGIRVRIPMHREVKREFRLMKRKGEYVFRVLAGRYVDSDRSESGFVEEVLDHIKIDRESAHVTFHCWRHTFRTMMAAADVPKDIAMKLGGWTHEKTEEMYNHFDNYAELERAINSLE
jgi:integrase